MIVTSFLKHSQVLKPKYGWLKNDGQEVKMLNTRSAFQKQDSSGLRIRNKVVSVSFIFLEFGKQVEK